MSSPANTREYYPHRTFFHETVKPKPETGSPFDRTVPTAAKVGVLTVESGPVDESAFSAGLHKATKKADPQQYLKLGDGLLSLAKQELDKSHKSSSPIKKACLSKAERSNPPNSMFRLYHERGELPIQIQHGAVKNKVQWKIDPGHLDYNIILPVFMDGLREVEEPYAFLAYEGTLDLLTAAPYKVLGAVPHIVVPLKTSLSTRNHAVIVKVVHTLKALVLCDSDQERSGLVGRALVPYYKHLLPTLNVYYNEVLNLGDQIDYGQRKYNVLGHLVQELLEELEVQGGDDAFINIKYHIPAYQSIRGRDALKAQRAVSASLRE